MRRHFPVVAIAAGLALVLLAVFRPVFADSPADAGAAADAPGHVKVRVERSDGEPVEGRLKLPAVTLKTETGSTTIEMPHVRRITFQRDPSGSAQDVVQRTDKTMVRGRVTVERFVVLPDEGGPVTLTAARVREIRVLDEVPPTVLAILLGLLTLTAMEIILGVDNVIFLAIIAGKLPEEQRPKARRIGLAAALGTRLLLLFTLTWILGLTAPVFTLPSFGFLHDLEAREVSWRDIILLAGGLFLIGKSVFEMHEKLEHARREREGESAGGAPAVPVSFAKVILTIAVIDIVFSLDSVITAVGMVETLWVMVVAMVIAMLVMLYFAKAIADFVDRHPTIKVLALAFLILIGVMLVAEGMGQHIDKGYIYAAMAFAVVVEMINMRLRKPAKASVEA